MSGSAKRPGCPCKQRPGEEKKSKKESEEECPPWCPFEEHKAQSARHPPWRSAHQLCNPALVNDRQEVPPRKETSGGTTGRHASAAGNHILSPANVSGGGGARGICGRLSFRARCLRSDPCQSWAPPPPPRGGPPPSLDARRLPPPPLGASEENLTGWLQIGRGSNVCRNGICC